MAIFVISNSQFNDINYYVKGTASGCSFDGDPVYMFHVGHGWIISENEPQLSPTSTIAFCASQEVHPKNCNATWTFINERYPDPDVYMIKDACPQLSCTGIKTNIGNTCDGPFNHIVDNAVNAWTNDEKDSYFYFHESLFQWVCDEEYTQSCKDTSTYNAISADGWLDIKNGATKSINFSFHSIAAGIKDVTCLDGSPINTLPSQAQIITLISSPSIAPTTESPSDSNSPSTSPTRADHLIIHEGSADHTRSAPTRNPVIAIEDIEDDQNSKDSSDINQSFLQKNGLFLIIGISIMVLLSCCIAILSCCILMVMYKRRQQPANMRRPELVPVTSTSATMKRPELVPDTSAHSMTVAMTPYIVSEQPQLERVMSDEGVLTDIDQTDQDEINKFETDFESMYDNFKQVSPTTSGATPGFKGNTVI